MIAFKYRACKEEKGQCRDIDMLLANQLYASPLKQLNDCFEGSYSDSINNQLDEIATTYHYNVTVLKRQWKELKKTVEGVGVYSLSLPEEDYPNNKLLWSQYAAEYTGFCIAYDVDKLVQNEQFPWLVNRLKVDYQNNVPKIDVTDFSSETQLLQKMLGTKGLDWEREKEFRLVYDIPGVKLYNMAALKAVYMGFRMPEAHKQRIVNGLQGRNVDIYEMTPMIGSYNFKADLRFSIRRKIDNPLKNDLYEIIDTNHQAKVENFYVLYKDADRSEERLTAFVNKFRDMHATMAANVELYDSMVVKPFLKKMSLNDAELKIMKEHSLGMSTFDAPDFFWKDVFD